MTNFTKPHKTSCDIQVKQVGENSCSTCNNLCNGMTWDDCQSHAHSTSECLYVAHHKRERHDIPNIPKPNTQKTYTKLNRRATSDSSASAELDRAWVDRTIPKERGGFFPESNPKINQNTHEKNMKNTTSLPPSSFPRWHGRFWLSALSLALGLCFRSRLNFIVLLGTTWEKRRRPDHLKCVTNGRKETTWTFNIIHCLECFRSQKGQNHPENIDF